MPELPDIEAYIHALRSRVVGGLLKRIRIGSPFLLRTFEPPVEAIEGLPVIGIRRLGKRIVFEFDTGGRFPLSTTGEHDPLFLVLHLMITGRLLWKDQTGPLVKGPGKITQGMFEFGSGTLILTEASMKKRASLHVVKGAPALAAHDPGGLELLEPATTAALLAMRLRRENRTIKRALTDPRTISGVGNAFSDEILHAARMSPLLLTGKMTEGESARLLAAARDVLQRFTSLLCKRFEMKFPGSGEVTAFRPEFAVHGKFGEACPVCGTKVARIVRADNETNYCPGCQTGGKLLADRSLSRLLGADWGKEEDD